MLSPDGMTPLFQATAEATEEAILNALAMATTTTGVEGRIAHALPLEFVRDMLLGPVDGRHARARLRKFVE